MVYDGYAILMALRTMLVWLPCVKGAGAERLKDCNLTYLAPPTNQNLKNAPSKMAYGTKF